jgi:hypothetical protein
MLTACGSVPQVEKAIPEMAAYGDPAQSAVLPIEPGSTPAGASPEEQASGFPAEVEMYYKTTVFIEGTAQLMAKLDLKSLNSNPAGFASLLMIPGRMDDRVIAAQQAPLPVSLGPAWEDASQAEAALMQALEDLLMSFSQEKFSQAVVANGALASEAVAEAEAVLAAEYGASADDIAAANRAALTEMGEACKTIASMLVVVQSEAGNGGE